MKHAGLASLISLFFHLIDAHLLQPAILSTTLKLKSDTIEYVGFPQSALNGTEVEIRLKCTEEMDVKFNVQYVIRSSPCDKEFFDVAGRVRVKDLLNFYFEHDHEIPEGYNYDHILFYRSKGQEFTCGDAHGVMLVEEPLPHAPLTYHEINQTKLLARKKREFPGLNGDSLDGGAKLTLSSWHPAQTLPMDGIYFLIVKFADVKFGASKAQHISMQNITVEVQWRGPYGYLSAIDYPLLHFYAFMCIFYIVLAIIWFVMCLRHWKDILRIQFWIGTVIIVGMVEKAMFYSEYSTMNSNGVSVEGFIEAAELVSCFKRTMSRVLIIIVSVGYGVVKPRLGNTLNQVVAVGFVYFIFCAGEGLARVSKNRTDAIKQKQIAALPLIMVEIGIFWWIFTALVDTMRVLRLRRNEIKLAVYRQFTNTLCFAVAVSALFMIWTIYIHNVRRCIVEWKAFWLDTALWHILFCSILVVIMVLWRPSKNNQRYAFTPLLDDSEDENDEDELFDTSMLAPSNVNKRFPSESLALVYANEAANQNNRELQAELKWMDDNIPLSLADRLITNDDDNEQFKLECSKML